MAKVVTDLTHKRSEIITGKDNVVMPEVYETIENGRSLDVSDFKGSHVYGGHIIIKKEGAPLYKPMPVSADGKKYEALPEGFKYAGAQYGTVTKQAALGAIATRCVYEVEAAPYEMDDILADIKAALPLITFNTKED